MRGRISFGMVVALMAVSLFAGMEIKSLISGDAVNDQANKYREVLSLAERYYVKEIDTKKLTEAALEGLLDQLDPHSVYLPARAFEQATEEFRGKFEGIGIRFTVRNDSILVVEIIGGGPSARVGCNRTTGLCASMIRLPSDITTSRFGSGSGDRKVRVSKLGSSDQG